MRPLGSRLTIIRNIRLVVILIHTARPLRPRSRRIIIRNMRIILMLPPLVIPPLVLSPIVLPPLVLPPLMLLLVLLLLVVFLDRVFHKASDDSTSNRSENAVVSLVASITASETSGYGSTNSTLAILCLPGSTLVILPRYTVRGMSPLFKAAAILAANIPVLLSVRFLLPVRLLRLLISVLLGLAVRLRLLAVATWLVVLLIVLLVVWIWLAVALLVPLLRRITSLVVLAVAVVLIVLVLVRTRHRREMRRLMGQEMEGLLFWRKRSRILLTEDAESKRGRIPPLL